MSKSSSTGLVLVFAVLAVGVAWFLTSGDPQPIDEYAAAAPGGPSVAADRDRDVANLEVSSTDDVDRDVVQSSVIDDAPETGAASVRRKLYGRPIDAIWVRGRVEFPAGVPLDEKMVVEAEGAQFPADPDGGRFHRSPVDEDGNFVVAFSPKTNYGRINIIARYLYLEEGYSVKLFDDEELKDIVLEPELGGLVVATILPPHHASFQDAPLQGVTLSGREGGWRAEELDGWWTGREGEWEIGGLHPDTEYTIKAASPIWADGRTEDVSVGAGMTEQIVVELSVGARISGTVVDELGEPVNNAIVRAMSPEAANNRGPFRRGNDDAMESQTRVGKFEFFGVPPGEITLVAEADGYRDGKFEIGELLDGNDRSNVLVTMSTGGKVSGEVRWPWGDPAEGAVVRVVQGNSMGGRFMTERLMGEITVGSDGFFAFSGLDEEKVCKVSASAIHPTQRPKPGSRVSRILSKQIPRWVATEVDVRCGSPPLDMMLVEGDILSGKVVNDVGEPVTTFYVDATPAGASMLNNSSRKPVRDKFKDEAGEFHLKGVQSGDWEVRVRAPGHATSERRSLTVPFSGDLEFQLARTATVTGKVIGPDGAQLPRANVWAEHGGGQRAIAIADKNGEFELNKIYPGEAVLFADAEKAARSQPLVTIVSAGENKEEVTLRVQRGATIVGTVHPDDGEREGRRVRLTGLRDDSGLDLPWSSVNESQRTNEDGEVKFTGLDAGEYRLEIEALRDPDLENDPAEWMLRNAGRKRQEVEVRAGQTLEVTLGGPQPGEIKVYGTITLNGEPVESGLVTGTYLDEEEDRPSAAGRADEDGNYKMTCHSAGKWRFSVRYKSGSWTTVVEDIEEGEGFELDFEIPETNLTGTVTGPDGVPVSGIDISLVDSDSDDRRNDWFAQRQASTDENGNYRFDSLAPGTYHLRAGGGDGGFGILEEEIEYGRVLIVIDVGKDSEPIERDVRLPSPGKVSGNVRSPEGHPVPGARIKITDEDGRPLSQFQFHRSGPDGAFTYKGLGPGTYLISAHKDGVGESEPRKASLSEGGTATVQIQLVEQD